MKKLCMLVAIVMFSSCGGEDPPTENGGACLINEDCVSDMCVTETQDSGLILPDGLCTNECDITDPNTCDITSEICLEYRYTGEQMCFQTCEAVEDCREGWTCFFVGIVKACIPTEAIN